MKVGDIMKIASKEKLEQMYLVEKLGSFRIAKRLGVTKTSVLRWLGFYGIPIRKGKEAHKHRGKDVWTKGGRVGHISGYVRLWNPELKKYEWEHRVVWEKYNGKIPEGFHVHHINGIRNDNRIENLELLPKAVHTAMHTLERWKKEGLKGFGR